MQATFSGGLIPVGEELRWQSGLALPINETFPPVYLLLPMNIFVSTGNSDVCHSKNGGKINRLFGNRIRRLTVR
jgi:hypothetical protein